MPLMRHIFPSIFRGLEKNGRVAPVGVAMTGTLRRHLACVALLTLVLPPAALAQAPYPPQAVPPQAVPPPPGAAANPVCTRLEAQLAAIDRGVSADPARAEQTHRIEDT